MKCKIKTCETTKVLARGWCSRHYGIWRRTGNPIAYTTRDKNTFRLENDSVIIELRDKKGNKIGETILDTYDFDKVKDVKWCLSKQSGYAVSGQRNKTGSKTLFMHRLIMGEPDSQVDHRNRNKLDNRRRNLRICTQGQNSRNRIKFSRSTTSGYIGVSYSPSTNLKKVWLATAKFAECRQLHWGRYDSEIEAAYIRDQIVLQLGDGFSVLNVLEYD